MRLPSYSLIWLASCVLMPTTTRIWAFVPTNHLHGAVALGRGTFLSPLNGRSLETQDCECDNPDDINAISASASSLVHQKGSGELFRSANLIDVDGNMVRLGDKMGEGKSVVIFLRHLG